MFQALLDALSESHFMPHGFCMRWDPSLVSTIIVANVLIALSYFAIPCALIYFVSKRKDLVFSWMFVLFGVFIVSCGITHLLKIWTIYHAAYWPEAIVDLVTGLVSALTAFLLWPLIPKALSLPSPAQLEESNRQLTNSMEETHKLNQELKKLNDESRQARDLAIEASNTKSAFVASISHELRTPLTGIIGMNELLLSSRLDDEQILLASNVQAAASSLLAVVNDILDLAKLEAGKLAIEVVEFNLADLLKECLSIVDATARAKGLPLKLTIDAGFQKPIIGDAARLKQIIINLLSNAIKFTEIGSVELQADLLERDENRILVRVSVTDTGSGISEHALEKIFQPFTQADQGSMRRFGGTGLGLSISNYLANLMDSKVEVQSRVGEGSKFWLDLQLEESKMKGTIQQGSTHATRPLPPAHVLVVDDDAFLQKLARKQLEKLDLKVTVTGNANEALELLEQKVKFDLILMDCHMPGMDGFGLTKVIRAMEQYANIPIIAVTAGAMKGEYERCLAGGMNDYLSKPYTLKQLSDVLSKWLVGENSLAPPAMPEANASMRSDAEGIVDLQKLLDAYGAEGRIEILQTFFDTGNKIMTELQQARDSENREHMKFLAHRFKGAAAMACMEPIAKTCSSLEHCALEAPLNEIDQLFSTLNVLLQRADIASKNVLEN